MKPEHFEQALDLQLLALRDLMVDRQRKYGSTNITTSGVHGLLVRMSDKLARIRHDHRNCLFSSCAELPAHPDEDALDAYRDLANYAGIIYPMLVTGQWGLPMLHP